MEFFRRRSSLIESIICSLALMIFSFFITFALPLKIISFSSLLVVAYIFSKNIKTITDFTKITGPLPDTEKTILYLFTGAVGGLALAIFYRWYLGIPLVPGTVKWFAAVAALIGSIEELVFRGYLQDSVRKSGTLLSITFSTLSHTGYKCCLFISPMAVNKVDIGFLAIWTIIAGMIFGTIRHYSKSIIPPLTGHALFDIWVYAGFVKAPWWVW
jgi:membrane protease YdiL (CAAX protease family)